jgi:hypothetical protein
MEAIYPFYIWLKSYKSGHVKSTQFTSAGISRVTRYSSIGEISGKQVADKHTLYVVPCESSETLNSVFPQNLYSFAGTRRRWRRK